MGLNIGFQSKFQDSVVVNPTLKTATAEDEMKTCLFIFTCGWSISFQSCNPVETEWGRFFLKEQHAKNKGGYTKMNTLSQNRIKQYKDKEWQAAYTINIFKAEFTCTASVFKGIDSQVQVFTHSIKMNKLSGNS